MSDPVDQEVDAIKTVLSALLPLSEKARVSVLDYVRRRLSMPTDGSPQGGNPPSQNAAGGSGTGVMHIKQFKEEKNPRSANEMAAIVAYYLANVVAASERKTTINQKDIETQFKIAGFPLPQYIPQTLPNAKNAGYFDLVGKGEYRLNAVGHNLVAHSLPHEQMPAAKRHSPRRASTTTKKPKQGRKRSS